MTIRLIAGTSFLTAYSGTLYLIKELEAQGCNVIVHVPCQEGELELYREQGLEVRELGKSKLPGFLVRLRFRGVLLRLSALMVMLCSRRVILTESTYLREASFVKKIKGRSMCLVHYCQELHLADEYPQLPSIQLLNRLARVPDRVIDVEPNRARIRHEKLSLGVMPWVLLNTLPMKALPERRPAGSLAKLACCELPSDIPILLHMGGIGREKPMERVLEAVETCGRDVFFLAFCNGSEDQLVTLRQEALDRLGEGMFHIVGPKKRLDLLSSAWEADIGLVDYSPSVEHTSNQKYCAPTKLYEFMALGLAILGSDNPSMQQVVEGAGAGVCARGGTPKDLAEALCLVLEDPKALQEMKRCAIQAFASRFSYEKANSPVVEEITDFMMNS